MKKFIILLVIAIALQSCSTTKYCGPNKTNPVKVYNKQNKHYKDVARTFDASVKGTINTSNSLGNKVDISNIDASLGTKLTNLKEALNQNTTRFNDLLFRAAEAYNSRPCDTVVRDRYFGVLDSVTSYLASLAEIEAKVKQAIDNTNMGSADTAELKSKIDEFIQNNSQE